MKRSDKLGWLLVAAWATVTLQAAGGEIGYEVAGHAFTGGTTVSTAEGFELSGTTGQSSAGSLARDGFEVNGGVMLPAAPTDCNGDGSVNLADHAGLIACMTGPDGLVPSVCACLDVDDNDTVDLVDFAQAQRVYTGP